MAKLVPLSRGLNAIVDDEDFELVARHKWCLQSGGRYAGRQRGGRRCRELIYMHRLILGVCGQQAVDHVNGNGLDNRRANLRIADRYENMRNMRSHGDSLSGLKGVAWRGLPTSRAPWRALIWVGGGSISLGCFADPREAAKAYDTAAMKHFGDFSRTNEGMGLL